MGTRFAVTKECALHDNWKQTFLKASEQDTLYIDVGNPAVNGRVYKNKYAESRMKKHSPLKDSISGALMTKRMLNLSWWQLISSGMRSSKGEGSMSMRQQLRYAANAVRENKMMFEGDEEAGILSIGQVIGGIRDIPTCKELIERIVIQSEKTLDNVCKGTKA
jgi:NAD(P)H-dependent flavin oxidoreductase YrpB (nitropropane dioxygenase family)